jgi:hypothetical protein
MVTGMGRSFDAVKTYAMHQKEEEIKVDGVTNSRAEK